MSSSAIRSSRSSSPSAWTISVRRSSFFAYMDLISRSSSRISAITRASSPRIVRSSAIRSRRAACSVSTRVRRGADQLDHLVEVVERDQVALEDMRAFLGLAQLELRAADDDRALELEVVAQELE